MKKYNFYVDFSGAQSMGTVYAPNIDAAITILRQIFIGTPTPFHVYEMEKSEYDYGRHNGDYIFINSVGWEYKNF